MIKTKIVIAGATYTVKRNAIIYSLKVHECLVKLLWLNLLYQIMILNLIRQVTWDKISEIRNDKTTEEANAVSCTLLIMGLFRYCLFY